MELLGRCCFLITSSFLDINRLYSPGLRKWAFIFFLSSLPHLLILFLLMILVLHCQGTWYLMLFCYLNPQSHLILILYWNNCKTLPVLLSVSPSIAGLFISLSCNLLSVCSFFQEKFIGATFPEFMYKRSCSYTYFSKTLFIKFLLFFNSLFIFIKVILLINSSFASLVRGQLVLGQLS